MFPGAPPVAENVMLCVYVVWFMHVTVPPAAISTEGGFQPYVPSASTTAVVGKPPPAATVTNVDPVLVTPALVIDAVTVAEPLATAVTRPVAASTVATAVLLDTKA